MFGLAETKSQPRLLAPDRPAGVKDHNPHTTSPRTCISAPHTYLPPPPILTQPHPALALAPLTHNPCPPPPGPRPRPRPRPRRTHRYCILSNCTDNPFMHNNAELAACLPYDASKSTCQWNATRLSEKNEPVYPVSGFTPKVDPKNCKRIECANDRSLVKESYPPIKNHISCRALCLLRDAHHWITRMRK
jgi:hypothetical protein